MVGLSLSLGCNSVRWLGSGWVSCWLSYGWRALSLRLLGMVGCPLVCGGRCLDHCGRAAVLRLLGSGWYIVGGWGCWLFQSFPLGVVVGRLVARLRCSVGADHGGRGWRLALVGCGVLSPAGWCPAVSLFCGCRFFGFSIFFFKNSEKKQKAKESNLKKCQHKKIIHN